jgi:uncharacterized phage protein (TIGR02220 family)
MQIISLSNHIIRKALCLSLNEMAVLCDIKQMSQNPEYGYTCVKSKDKIAEWLDLSRATVFNAIKALELKGYVERNDIGVRPTQFIYDLDLAQDEIGIYIQKGDLTFITKKVESLLDGPSKIYTQTVQNLDGDSLKFRLGQSKIYTQDIHIDIHKEKKEDNTSNGQIELLVNRINEIAGTAFKATNKETSGLINARLKEYSVEDLLLVVEHKSAWLKDIKMKEYYRPSTLFRPTHFENYLNAAKQGTLSEGSHKNNPDFKLGAKRYRPLDEFATYKQYVENCMKYGHTPQQYEGNSI